MLLVATVWLGIDGARLLQRHQQGVAALEAAELDRLAAIAVGSAALLRPGGSPEAQQQALAEAAGDQGVPLALLQLRPGARQAVLDAPQRVHADAMVVVATSAATPGGTYSDYHPSMAPALLEGRTARGRLVGEGAALGTAHGPLVATDGTVLGLVSVERSLQPARDRIRAQSLRSLALSVVLLIAVGLVVGWSRAHQRRALQQLEASVVRLGLGDHTTHVEPPLTSDVGALADALEQTRHRIRRHTRELVRDKEILSDELAMARERLRDPVVDRRRTELARLSLGGRITLGRVSAEVRLQDLWLDHVVVAMEVAVLEQLVPGMPVQLSLEGPQGALPDREAIARAPTGDRVEGQQGYRFSWSVPWSPLELGDVLWDAVNPRRAVRISPPAHHQVRAVLELGERCHSAQVLDLSTDGIGVLLAASLSELGGLGGDVQMHLTLELDATRQLRTAVWVRSLDQRATGTRLGLAFEALTPGQLQPLEAYLTEVQLEAAGADEPSELSELSEPAAARTPGPSPPAPRSAPAPPRSPPTA